MYSMSRGKRVTTGVDEDQKGSYHEARFAEERLRSGAYFYSSSTGEFSGSHKPMLLK